MYRKVRTDEPALERLREERDHLKIQVSIVSDKPKIDAEELFRLNAELRDLELSIDALERIRQ